ncbi:glutamate-gated chloride channel-like [Galendromus occidentalis]|uniref:Glutamate-gated chloride channel-like n=1 Tax=Galendromus occidentalis TaxID=34638 RepID=A0AAJ6VZJ3_9ACAR|nr:glutamate-gated chloride channel-like [Galendromus occidentalis]
MPSLTLTLLCFLLRAHSVALLCVQGAGEPDDIGVLDCLLEGYDVLLRPQNLTVVDISLLADSSTTPDETSLDYRFTLTVGHRYIDERLQFEPNNATSPAPLNAWYHMRRIWRPALTVLESRNDLSFDPEHAAMRIWPSGLIELTRSLVVDMRCRTIYELFPFDKPVCIMTFVVTGSTGNEVQLRWLNQYDDLTSSETVYSNTYLEATGRSDCPQEEMDQCNYTCLKALLLFARERTVYWVTVFIPGFILVTSSFMTFWLSLKAPQPRVMIGTTTRLNFLATARSFRNKVPAFYNLVAMNIWDSVGIIFIYMSLCEFILAVYIDRHPRANEEEDARYLEAIRKPGYVLTAKERFLLYFKRSNKQIAADIEWFSRIVIPGLYFLFIIGYFVAFQGHYHHEVGFTYGAFEKTIDL